MLSSGNQPSASSESRRRRPREADASSDHNSNGWRGFHLHGGTELRIASAMLWLHKTTRLNSGIQFSQEDDSANADR